LRLDLFWLDIGERGSQSLGDVLEELRNLVRGIIARNVQRDVDVVQ
jgi:hypothetical protein